MFKAWKLVGKLKSLIKSGDFFEAIRVHKELGEVLATYKESC